MKKNKHWMIVLALILAVVGTAFVPQVVHAESGVGEGVLTAEGDAEIEVSGEGRKQELASGRTRYVGFEGEAMVSGSRVSLALSGYDITLQASGIGKFWLRGEGMFSTGVIGGKWKDSFESYKFE